MIIYITNMGSPSSIRHTPHILVLRDCGQDLLNPCAKSAAQSKTID